MIQHVRRASYAALFLATGSFIATLFAFGFVWALTGSYTTALRSSLVVFCGLLAVATLVLTIREALDL